ncbi:hypothetical protein Q8F55_003263 [Vanrija albida]|uniref:F-box domain-containing protein n=1 Tax=Vanrija albida TaxID=181172 RepID=A0ABR3QCM1_9TREE
MAVSVDDITDDVLLAVLSTCDLGDRQRLRATCRRLKALHDDSDTLRYELELVAAGLKESPPLVPEAVFRPDPKTSRTGDVMVCHAGAPHTYVYYPKKPAESMAAVWAPWQEHRGDITVPAMPIAGRATLSVKEKRERLKALQERWMMLMPAVTRTIRYDGVFNPNWMVFNAAVMLQTTGFQGHPDRPNTMFPGMLMPFPSATNPDLHTPYLSGKRYQVFADSMGSPVNSRGRCAMDPAQNLLVFPMYDPGSRTVQNGVSAWRPASYKLALFSMLSPSPHPRAAKDHLTWPLLPRWLMKIDGLYGVIDGSEAPLACELGDVRIFGTTVAASIKLSRPQGGYYTPVLCMWNWVTGELLAEIVGHHSQTSAESFELLGERTVLIVSSNLFDGHAAAAESVPMCFTIWTIPENEPLGKDPHPGVCLVQLEMPRLKEVCYETWITPLRQGAATRAVGGSPFAPDDARGLIRVSFRARNQYNCYILRETLLAMAREGEERVRGPFRVALTAEALSSHSNPDCKVPACTCTGTSGGFRCGAPVDPWEAEDEHGRTYSATDDNLVLRRYAWAEWGPTCSRMTYTDEGPNSGPGRILRKYATAGYRDVLIGSAGGNPSIEVRDFSPALVARVTAGKVDLPPGVTAEVSAFGELSADHVWVDDVFTSLPYVSIKRDLPVFPFMALEGGPVLVQVVADEQRLCYGAHQKLEGVDGAGAAVYKTELMVLCM